MKKRYSVVQFIGSSMLFLTKKMSKRRAKLAKQRIDRKYPSMNHYVELV